MSDLKVIIGADNSQLNSALAQSQGKVSGFSATIEKQLTQLDGKIGSFSQSAGSKIEAFKEKISSIGDVGGKLAGLGGVLSASITLPLTALASASIKAYGDMQSLQMGLEAVMGSAERASAEFEKLKEVAKLPGLGLKEAVQGSVALQSAGFSANQARKSLMAFGNALATVGKGANEMNMVILALTQLQNKSSGFGQDLRQLTEQLPQLRGALTEAFGTSDSEAIAKTGKTGREVVEMLTKEFEKLPKVTGGIKNAFENLRDNLTTNLARIGKVLDKNINISGLIDKVTGAVDKIVSAFENLDPAFQTTILGVAGFAAAIGPLLVTVGGFMAILPTLTAGVTGLGAAFTAMTGPIGLVVIGIGAIVAAVVTNWDKITPYLQGTLEYFQRLYKESTVFRLSVQGIGFAFNALGMIAVEVVKNIWQNFKTLGKGLLETFAGVGGVIEGALTLDWDKVKEGYKRGMAGIANSVVGIAVNSINSFNNVLNNLDSIEKRWSGLNIDSIKVPGLDKAVEKEADDKISKGLKAAAGKAKTIELPDVEPIKFGGSVDKLSFLGKMFGTPLEMENYINGLIDTTAVGLNRLNTTVDNALVTLAQKKLRMDHIINDFNISLSNMLNEAVVTGISDAFNALGNSMATGQNALSSIGKSLLSTLGGVLTQLGKMAITAGLGILGIQTALKSLNPYVALAAGAALVALGGAVTGAVGNLGNSMGSSGGSVGTSNGSNFGGTQSYNSNYSSSGSFDREFVFRIDGYDLTTAVNRNQQRNNRLNAG